MSIKLQEDFRMLPKGDNVRSRRETVMHLDTVVDDLDDDDTH